VVVLKIIEEIGGEKQLISVCYSPGTALERRENSTRLPWNQGIAYQSLVNKSIRYSNDVLNDSVFWPMPQRQHFADTRYRTIAVAPIITNDAVCGLLCFDWREPNKYCAEYDQMIACFTDVISIAFYIAEESRHLTHRTEGVAPH
jgi:hypothetical protein